MDILDFVTAIGAAREYTNKVALEHGAVPVPGPAGKGVPEGGTQGQILRKKSNANFDTEWADETMNIEFLSNAEIKKLFDNS